MTPPIYNKLENSDSPNQHCNSSCIRFCFCLLLFFPDFLLICYFLRSSVDTLTNIPFGIIFVHFFSSQVINFYSLFFIDSRFFLSICVFLNNSKKNKKRGIVFLNLVNKQSQSETKIKRMQIQGKNQQRAIYVLLYLHIYLYFFWLGLFNGSSSVCKLFRYKILHFLEFSSTKRRDFSLSRHIRCISSTVMFIFEYTFQQFMQCSFKTGSRNLLMAVVFFQGNNDSGELSLTRIK